jgi:hypothetical protein
VWRPSLASSIPELLTHAFGVAHELNVVPGWVRYPTDGTRLQVFDANECGVCKVLLPDVHARSLVVELATRQKVGDLSPAVTAISHNANAYVEEWIVGSQPLHSLDALERVLHRLQDTLYSIEWIDLDQLLVKLTKWGRLSDEMLEAVHCAFASLGGKDRVPWSVVHGDLVEHNLLLNKAKEMVLIDWEYTRECIVTYDCWLYQYWHRRAAGRGDLDVSTFCREFGRCLNGLVEIKLADLNLHSLHLLHLIERMHYLAHISPNTTAIARRTMLRDIRNAYKGLVRN